MSSASAIFDQSLGGSAAFGAGLLIACTAASTASARAAGWRRWWPVAALPGLLVFVAAWTLAPTADADTLVCKVGPCAEVIANAARGMIASGLAAVVVLSVVAVGLVISRRPTVASRALTVQWAVPLLLAVGLLAS